jgi:hypothetical protein
MHWRTFGENLMKIGLILSAQWQFSAKRQKGCPVTLTFALTAVNFNYFFIQPAQGRQADILTYLENISSYIIWSQYVI